MKTIDVSKIDFVKLSPDDRRAVERRDRRRERERFAVRIESRIRWLVMFLRGPGGQSQFSVQLSARLAERKVCAKSRPGSPIIRMAICRVQRWRGRRA